MLSEEEKKAIEMIEIIVDECKLENKRKGYEGVYYDGDTPIPYKEYEIVLNLITKLQKEIEHQKEKRENQKVELAILNEKQKEMNKLTNTVSSYKGMFKRQQKDQEKKDKIIDLMARAIDNYDSQLVINTFKDKEHVKQYFEKLAKEKGE